MRMSFPLRRFDGEDRGIQVVLGRPIKAAASARDAAQQQRVSMAGADVVVFAFGSQSLQA